MARRVVHLRTRAARERETGGGEAATLDRDVATGDASAVDDRAGLDTRGGNDATSGVAGAAVPADSRPSAVSEGSAVDAAGSAPAPPKRARRSRREQVGASLGAALARAARTGGDAASDPSARGRSGGPNADAFGERLRALEREIDEALAGAGTAVEPGVVIAAREAADELLAFYADLARAFWRGGLGEVFIRARMVGTPDRVEDFGYDAAFAARMAPLLAFLYERWWRVELSGAEHVPASGRVLLVANHSGGFLPYDGLMLAHGMRAHRPGGGRAVRPLVEDFVYHFPWIGPALTRLGAVRASAENAERLLAAEHAVAVFPEGAKGVGKYYRDRYRLQRFARGGFVTLALRTGAPLVPVAIVGAEEIHPIIAKSQWLARAFSLPYFPVTPTFPLLGALGLVPLPTKWRIVFGPAIDLAAEHGRDAAEDDLLVNRVNQRVRERIQRMLVDALRTRDSVFA